MQGGELVSQFLALHQHRRAVLREISGGPSVANWPITLIGMPPMSFGTHDPTTHSVRPDVPAPSELLCLLRTLPVVRRGQIVWGAQCRCADDRGDRQSLYAFASVWCFYPAAMSVLIYWQFKRLNIDIETPNGTSPILRSFLIPWLRLRARAP